MNNLKKKFNTDNLLEYFKKYLNLDFISSKYLIPINYGAMFAVNKNIIQKHKKSFYINLNKLLLSTKRF